MFLVFFIYKFYCIFNYKKNKFDYFQKLNFLSIYFKVYILSIFKD